MHCVYTIELEEKEMNILTGKKRFIPQYESVHGNVPHTCDRLILEQILVPMCRYENKISILAGKQKCILYKNNTHQIGVHPLRLMFVNS